MAHNGVSKIKLCTLFLLFCLNTATAVSEEIVAVDANLITSAPDAIPDIRGDESELISQKRDLVVVPIPVSNPTFDTGLVLAGAYFYRQTEQQKKVQPASVTGAAGFYSSNKSFAFGVAHQSYWSENNWRFSGAFGHVDLKLNLLTIGTGDSAPSVDWLIKGDFLTAGIARKVAGKWYVGVFSRYIDMDQGFSLSTPSIKFDTDTRTRSVGLGIKLEYDNRDKPLNSYSGSIFKADVLINDAALGSDDSYQSYSLRYSSYHSLSSSAVLAWEARVCGRSGRMPLWDACKVGLRGFSATDYLGKSSVSAQVETRWRLNPKWGVVAFVGGGQYRNSFSGIRDQDLIPSYGIGLRFMVLASQRINIRLDYARSTDNDAVYLSIGEAF